jgi:hypothetical protein
LIYITPAAVMRLQRKHCKMDSLFGLNMQKSGLRDTMWDLIVDALGALVVSILGYLYLKGYIKLFERLDRRLIKRSVKSTQQQPDIV